MSTGVTTVRSIHITELRSALLDVYVAAGRTPLPVFTNPTLVAGETIVAAAHVAEIRAAIVAIW
jgi:hypothetical protein